MSFAAFYFCMIWVTFVFMFITEVCSCREYKHPLHPYIVMFIGVMLAVAWPLFWSVIVLSLMFWGFMRLLLWGIRRRYSWAIKTYGVVRQIGR